MVFRSCVCRSSSVLISSCLEVSDDTEDDFKGSINGKNRIYINLYTVTFLLVLFSNAIFLDIV